jgi:DNA adenine methylase
LITNCEDLGLTQYKSKNKGVLIELIRKNNEPIISSETQPKHLKPLVKWSGGKGDEIRLFEKYFPESYNTYIEPFAGGAAVLFYLNPSNAVIGDVHKELIALYKSIGDGKSQEIFEFMENNPNVEETYYHIRDKMPIECDLDLAKRFYYQRKTCFRGMLRYNKDGKFNIPFGKYKTINYSELLNPSYESLLSRTEILSESFETIFERYNDENNFMFLDPPYDSEFTDYGYCSFGKDHHVKLAECFKTTKIRCLMVIGKTQFIEELYKDFICDEYDKKYRFKLYGNRVGEEINTVHLVIKNY